MSKQKQDQYEKLMKAKPLEVAVELLALWCREKDRRIAELKEEIQAIQINPYILTGRELEKATEAAKRGDPH